LKILYAIFIAASAVFLVLSPIGLMIGLSIHRLQAEAQLQEADLQALEAKIEDQKQDLQTLAEKKEAQEKSISTLRKTLVEQQKAVQLQQAQMDKANSVVQQVAPNLLRDMATVATRDDRMKELLTERGFGIQMR